MWAQQFDQIEQPVPGAYIMPFDMSNHPTFKSTLDSYFFFAYDRVTEIHQTPIFIAEWETINKRDLRLDSKYAAQPDSKMADMVRAFSFLRSAIEASFHGRPVSHLMRERSIIELRDRIRSRAYRERVPEIADFRRLSVCMPANR